MKIRLFLAISLLLNVLCGNAQRVAMTSANPETNYTKGMAYINDKQIQRGIAMIKLAAGKGHLRAQLFLADSYNRGLYGPVNYEEAGYWYDLAAKQGDQQAINELQRLINDGLYKKKVEGQNQNGNTIIVQNYYGNGAGTHKTGSGESMPKTATKKSDIDTDIPTAKFQNDITFVVIIANENYQEETKVDYAINDGESFRQYCLSALGIPENHIKIRKDATLNNLTASLYWLDDITSTEKYRDKANVIFYYAGHGIPDEATGSSYLLPVDGKGNMINTAYSLTQLYKSLSSLHAKQVLVFMDACFSGAQRNGTMLASARGIAIKAKKENPIGNNVTVFSAASGDETAYPYKSQEHGLFTYYLLKKIKEEKGDCKLGDIFKYVHYNVTSAAIEENGKSQTPTVIGSGNWEELKLK